MRPENAARTLAMIGAFLLIVVALLRLLSVYLLISDPRLQAGELVTSGPDPALGLYAFSNDGQQVRFERGVFTDGIWQGGVYLLDLQTGNTTPGDLPEIPNLYTIGNGQVRLKQPGPGPGLALSPEGLRVTDLVYSPDGQALAFIDEQAPNSKQLYATRGLSPAEPILISKDIHDMAWSSDKQRLVFVAWVDDGGEEIFTYAFSDHQTTRLTTDGQAKSSPLFSQDGRQIAFLAAPAAEIGAQERSAAQERSDQERVATPVQQPPTPLQFHLSSSPNPIGTDIYLMDADGNHLRQLTDSPLDETGLAWTADGELAFSIWQPQWPAVAYLVAISTDGKDQRRIYPPVAIDTFTCQPVLPGGSQVNVQIGVSNDSAQAVTVPIEVSADRQPLDLLSKRSQFRVQREDVPLQAGEARTLAWKVNVPEDIRVYLAASVETGVEFPISAIFCEVTPRRLFLPRLPLLRTTLLVGLLGSILYIPWLRHTRRVSFWVLGASYWILLLALMLVESWILLAS